MKMMFGGRVAAAFSSDGSARARRSSRMFMGRKMAHCRGADLLRPFSGRSKTAPLQHSKRSLHPERPERAVAFARLEARVGRRERAVDIDVDSLVGDVAQLGEQAELPPKH